MTQSNTFSSHFREDSSQSIGFVFMKTYSAWQAEIKNCLKNQPITHPQFIVLATLAYLSQQSSEITQVILAQHANIDVMTVSQILEKLEKKTFVERSTSLKDSRAKSIVLTPAGYAIVNIVVPLIENIDRQFFSNLGADIGIFNNMLLKLLNK